MRCASQRELERFESGTRLHRHIGLKGLGGGSVEERKVYVTVSEQQRPIRTNYRDCTIVVGLNLVTANLFGEQGSAGDRRLVLLAAIPRHHLVLQGVDHLMERPALF